MSITLDTSGGTVTLPTGWTINSESQSTRIPKWQSSYKRGVVPFNFGAAESVKKITLAGIIKASDSTTLMTTLDSIQAVQGEGGLVYLTESVQGRTMKCIVAQTTWRKRTGLIIEGQIVLLGIDGVWTDSINTLPVYQYDTIAVEGATGNDNLININYAGTAPTRPSFMLRPVSSWAAPEIEWYGGNLIKNSSFADNQDGTDEADNWTRTSGKGAQWDDSTGHEDNFSLRIEGDGVRSHQWKSDTFAVNPSTQYTMSCYARSNSIESLRFQIQYLDENGTAANGDTNYIQTTTGDWVREDFTETSPITCSSARMNITIETGTSGGEFVWIDDVQVEESGTVSPYFNTNIGRNKHVTINRTNGIGAEDVMYIDMENGRAMLYDTSTDLYAEDNYEINGRFFELMPGINHIRVAYADAASGVSVTTQFSNKYY